MPGAVPVALVVFCSAQSSHHVSLGSGERGQGASCSCGLSPRGLCYLVRAWSLAGCPPACQPELLSSSITPLRSARLCLRGRCQLKMEWAQTQEGIEDTGVGGGGTGKTQKDSCGLNRSPLCEGGLIRRGGKGRVPIGKAVE